MKRKNALLQLLEPPLQRLSAFVTDRLKNRFYILLALLFTIAAVLDATVFHLLSTMNQKTFDLMMRHRIVKPSPDKDIVIIDIDEASLSAMAKEYGRWPWPRQVLGEFLENLEQQHPKAVVFDILFSDPDVFNADSDAYFNSAVEGTDNTFFPMLRLNEDNDRLSELMPWQIPGVTMIKGEPQKWQALALILPHFPAALKGARLGTHNIYPDKDGVARFYRIYRNDYGWKVPSLPLRIAQELKFPLPSEQEVLINWRGKPFTYPYVSFSNVFADFLNKEKKRPQNEFSDKIVIIGSTAPSLFDIKATPMDRLHPGVEILATAIDNVKHSDYLRVPQSNIPYLVLALVIVWMTAAGLFFNIDLSRFDRAFGLSQIMLVAVSYASINLTTTYIDLTGPVTVGLAYFSIARIYASATEKALEAKGTIKSFGEGGTLGGVLMLVHIQHGDEPAGEALLRRLRVGLRGVGATPRSTDFIKGNQSGIWGLVEGMMVLSWAYPLGDEALKARITADAEAIATALQPMVQKYAKNIPYTVSFIIHEGTLLNGKQGTDGSSWKHLFAEAVQRLFREKLT